METPFKNDPFAITYEAFKELYPDKVCECWFDTDIKADDGDDAFGITSFEPDGRIVVLVDANISAEAATETLAHEFAHVAAGYDAGHGAEWEKAFKAIFDKYEEICVGRFGC